MPAYLRCGLAEFLKLDPKAVVGRLESGHARDGYTAQLSQQTLAWAQLIPLLQQELETVLRRNAGASAWTVLLEFPLYRLSKRLVVVILNSAVVVLEAKIGVDRFRSDDERQVEEYALDLRDFHAG